MLELYHAGLTACSKKSRLCLKEKGLSYVSHLLILSKFEHHRPEYLAINPNGLVPALVHDGAAIYESSVINEYVDDAFPDMPLRPSGSVEKARMRLWTKLADEALLPNMVTTFSRAGSVAASAKELDDKTLDDVLSHIPLKERRDIIHKVARGGGFTADDRKNAREKAKFIVDRAERDLSSKAYLAGDSYSLADINMIPFMDRFHTRVVPDLFTAERVPNLFHWYQRVMARPAVIATFSPSEETRRPAAS